MLEKLKLKNIIKKTIDKELLENSKFAKKIRNFSYSNKANIFNDINLQSIKSILNSSNFSQTMKLYRTMLKRDWQISSDKLRL